MSPDRRGWLLAGGVATAAAAAGLGWALWRERAATTAPAVDAELWAASFDMPDGQRLSLASYRGQPLVLNFWATWCPPCVREMPALDRFARDFAGQGWRVVGLAADAAEPVRNFLARAPVSYAIGLTGFAGIELSRRLGNHNGALPFTLVFGRDGRVRQRHLGESQYEQLVSWAKGI